MFGHKLILDKNEKKAGRMIMIVSFPVTEHEPRYRSGPNERPRINLPKRTFMYKDCLSCFNECHDGLVPSTLIALDLMSVVHVDVIQYRYITYICERFYKTKTNFPSSGTPGPL
ncbi:hypothetical protein BLOT_005856 [Blomia tropicalis]|nr:hypothetical protein BLOT_005856 [Blomia tropicalis]